MTPPYPSASVSVRRSHFVRTERSCTAFELSVASRARTTSSIRVYWARSLAWGLRRARARSYRWTDCAFRSTSHSVFCSRRPRLLRIRIYFPGVTRWKFSGFQKRNYHKIKTKLSSSMKSGTDVELKGRGGFLTYPPPQPLI